MTSSRVAKDDLDHLINAAKNGSVETLQTMIQIEKHDVDTRGSKGGSYFNGTLLLISCENGKIKAVKKLLQLGADIEAVDELGYNALHIAAYKGYADVINLLYTKKPDLIKQTTIHGETALHKAALCGHVDIVDLLLIKNPDLVLQADDDGETALHKAAFYGHVDIVNLLLTKNPDLVIQTDNRGETALDWAVIMDNSAVVWTMVHYHKADIIQCCKQGRQEKAKELLEAAEEARRAKSAEENTNALNQGNDDRFANLAYSFALKFGKDFSRELQVLMVGAENTGKTCLVASFLGEKFIAQQKPTEGADTKVCKIYCENWSRISLSDMKMHLYKQFIRQFKKSALKAMPNTSDQKSDSVLSSSSGKGSLAKVNLANLPQPNPTDVQEASCYTSTNDSDSVNAVVWDFGGQVIFHNTHSIFISESGVPVITFNASLKLTDDIVVRKGATVPPECFTVIESIHYWLQVVDSMCSVKGSDDDHSPLLPTALLAGTHIDMLHPDIKEARKIAKGTILPVLEKELLEKPYARHLAGIRNGIKAALEEFCFFVSNKHRDEEIDRLKKVTTSVASCLRIEQPIFFLNIEQSLLLLEKQVISKSMLADIVAKCSFSMSEDSPEFKDLLHYFHSKRTILYFSEIESLKDLIILSPRWLAKLFSYVITAHSYVTGTKQDNAWKQLTNYGILHENLLVHMLEKFHADYPTAARITKQQVIDILLYFHLVALINRKAWFAETGYPSIPQSGKTFIVPSLVPRDERKAIPCTEKERIVYFKFDSGFIPTSVLNQLIANCICYNVKKENQLLWMRHGKVGLQLGLHQKYYISRCQEKQSIQLTITVSGNDAKCVKERAELINDVTKLLTDIMKVFMPAAERPVLFVPCPLCHILHITLKRVYEGCTVFCPLSGDDRVLHGYYSDLLSSPSTEASIKLEVFTKNYARLAKVLPIKSLTHHFIKDKIISSDEEETIMQTVDRSEAARMVLRKIGNSLEAHLTTSLDKLLSIMEQYGGTSCIELVNEMRQNLPQDITAVQHLLSSDVPSEQSAEHEKHLQSYNTIVCNTDVSTKPSIDDERHEQSCSTTVSDTDVSSGKLSSEQERHKQSHNTAALEPPTKKHCLAPNIIPI